MLLFSMVNIKHESRPYSSARLSWRRLAARRQWTSRQKARGGRSHEEEAGAGRDEQEENKSTVEASPHETFHKKANPETPGRPSIFDAGTSSFPRQNQRNPRNPGHPGGKQGVSRHGPPL
ncbi:unnamed protein product [Prorocentrum cordatum]|uniref:Uncharacterized protein n=1 Tax=Prorocentrum cordatum TaxID=2364126 RepID=A0ABN9QWL6_9DINO|nr:unnamed protein product [Polarella glacialis]